MCSVVGAVGVRAAAPRSRSVVFVESQGVTSKGQPVPFKFKVIRFGDGEIRWAVRDVLDAFYSAKANWEASIIINSQMETVEDRLTTLGTSFWKEFTPNFQAYDAAKSFHDGEGVDTKHMREDFHVTTKGFITWLLTWSASRHKDADKSKAKAILEGVMMNVLDASGFTYNELFDLFDHVFDRCIMRNSQAKPCGHVSHIMKSLPKTARQLWSWRAFVEMLMEFLFDSQCEATKHVFLNLLDHMDELITKYMWEQEGADVLTESVPFYTPKGKRRRICEDFRDTLTQTKVDCFIRPTQVVQFLDMADSSTCAVWAINDCKAYRSAAQRDLTMEGVVCHADDSSGHGKPAESTLMGVVWDARARQCAIPMPTVTQSTPHDRIPLQRKNENYKFVCVFLEL
jgi:hypothetical protein